MWFLKFLFSLSVWLSSDLKKISLNVWLPKEEETSITSLIPLSSDRSGSQPCISPSVIKSDGQTWLSKSVGYSVVQIAKVAGLITGQGTYQNQ